MNIDESKRLNADAAWLLQEAMQTVYDLRVAAYADVGPDLRVRQASPGFPLLLSEPVAEIEGQLLPDLIWEFAGVEDELTAVLHREKPLFRLNWVNRPTNGRPAYFDFVVRFLERPGAGLLFLAEDTTFRGELQQQLHQERNQLHLLKEELSAANDRLRRLDRMKSLFLSMAAHDLRTPLTAISGFTDLIIAARESLSPEKMDSYLQLIRAQTYRLQRLTSDIVNLDQIEQGKFLLHLRPVNLNEVVEQVAAVLRHELERREQKLWLALSTVPLPMQIDRPRIEQVLYNLLHNAMKFTPEGGTITISTRREGKTAVFQVADTGPGMTPDEVKRLFQLYYRTDAANEQKIQGTGLGLYIVRQITLAHGGQVSVESHPGEGSVFTVELPL